MCHRATNTYSKEEGLSQMARTRLSTKLTSSVLLNLFDTRIPLPLKKLGTPKSFCYLGCSYQYLPYYKWKFRNIKIVLHFVIRPLCANINNLMKNNFSKTKQFIERGVIVLHFYKPYVWLNRQLDSLVYFSTESVGICYFG